MPEAGGAGSSPATASLRASMQRKDTAQELSALGAAEPAGSGEAAQEGLEAAGDGAQERAAARVGVAELDVAIAVEAAPGARSGKQLMDANYGSAIEQQQRVRGHAAPVAVSVEPWLMRSDCSHSDMRATNFIWWIRLSFKQGAGVALVWVSGIIGCYGRRRHRQSAFVAVGAQLELCWACVLGSTTKAQLASHLLGLGRHVDVAKHA